MLIKLLIACGATLKGSASSGSTHDLRGDVDVRALQREFPSVEMTSSTRRSSLPFVDVDVASWRDSCGTSWVLDAHIAELDVAGAFAVRIEGDSDDVADVAFEVLTRYQRTVRRKNQASAGGLFTRLLTQYDALFDRERQPARTDYARGLDAWQWMLRLCPTAGLAAQIVALLLPVGGPDPRLQRGVLSALLGDVELDSAERARAERLLDSKPPRPAAMTGPQARRDLTLGDPEALALLDADTLSFLSLGAEELLRERGATTTRARVARSFQRLRPENRFYLATMRHEPAIDDMLYELMAIKGSAAALRG